MKLRVGALCPQNFPTSKRSYSIGSEECVNQSLWNGEWEVADIFFLIPKIRNVFWMGQIPSLCKCWVERPHDGLLGSITVQLWYAPPPPPPPSRRRWLNWTAICTKPPSVRLRSKDCHTLETIPGVSHLSDNSQRRVKFDSKLCSSVWIAFQWVTLICRKTSIETDKCSFWKVKDLTVLVKPWLLTLDECQFSGVESSGWCEQRTF